MKARPTALRRRSLSWARAILDWFLPGRCPLCLALTGEPRLCRSCSSVVPAPRPPLCPCCGRPEPGRSREALCPRCSRARPGYDRARACALYGETPAFRSPLAELLHRYKYGREVTLARPLAHLLLERCPFEPAYDLLVPVPLHPERLRWRGFNHALLLARPLGRRWRLPVEPRVLRRWRDTPPQVGLPESQRRRNVAGAFRVRRPDRICGRRVLLVDDVLTTGATLDACARALRDAGAERVDALALAQVTGP